MKKDKHVDAIVVGAGASGGVVAKELAVNGIGVVLFEFPDGARYRGRNGRLRGIRIVLDGEIQDCCQEVSDG